MGENKALLQFNFKQPRNDHVTVKIHMITEKGLNFKNFGFFWVNSNCSPFLAKIEFFAIFCHFSNFVVFSTLNTEKTVVDEPQVLTLYERGTLNLLFPESKLSVRKIYENLLKSSFGGSKIKPWSLQNQGWKPQRRHF